MQSNSVVKGLFPGNVSHFCACYTLFFSTCHEILRLTPIKHHQSVKSDGERLTLGTGTCWSRRPVVWGFLPGEPTPTGRPAGKLPKGEADRETLPWGSLFPLKPITFEEFPLH